MSFATNTAPDWVITMGSVVHPGLLNIKTKNNNSSSSSSPSFLSSSTTLHSHSSRDFLNVNKDFKGEFNLDLH
jgi:hypothetical protein